jgi:hypothetical protein
MPNTHLAEVLGAWHDLYMLVGTASATLVGLLFVAASVGARFFTADRHMALRLFLSPSVVHFTSVLVACLIAISPLRSWKVLAAFLGGDSLFGLLYAAVVWRNMVRHGFTTNIDVEDRVCYAVLPALGYAIMAAACLVLADEVDAGCGMLAFAMVVLLLVGIRNAWDMTAWMIIRTDN